MMIRRLLGAAILAAALAGCTRQELGHFLKGTAAGTAESACRAASNCSTGVRRDPLTAKPAWQTGGAAPKDSPFRLPAPK